MKSAGIKQIKRLWQALSEMIRLAFRAQPLVFIGLILLASLQATLPLASALLTKLLFDLLAAIVLQGRPIGLEQDLLLILLGQATVMLLTQMTSPTIQYLHAELQRAVTLTIQSDIYRKTSGFTGIAYFENPEFYDTIRLANRGAELGPTQSVITLTNVVQSAIVLAGFLGLLTAFNPLLTLLVGLAALSRFYAQLRIGEQRFSLASVLSPDERRGYYYQDVLSSIDPAKEIRLFDLANYFLGEFTRTFKRIHEAQRHQELRELRWKLVLEILSTSVSAFTFIVVVMQAFAGRLSLGDVTLYTNAVRSVQDGLNGVLYALSSLNEGALFYTHFQNLKALPQPIALSSRPQPVPPLRSGVELRCVSFRYTPHHPWVLREVNLFIPAGHCMALVGPNGVGKTTLVKLLTRLYDPTEGQILWDGVDIREFDPRELRHRLGAILQDFVRYELTAHENIGLGDVSNIKDTPRIFQAAQKAGAHQTIESLPQGYQTLLSRRFADDGLGVDLSGGEWQKIAVARMFMRQADLLILDEPTASLDAQSEHDLFHRFIHLVEGRTSLLISHRFSTVRMADTIAVLEEGHITSYGTHAELISQGGTYARLYNLQAGQYRQ